MNNICNVDIICEIMAINQDYNCLLLNKEINKKKYVFYMLLNKNAKHKLLICAAKNNKIDIIQLLYIDISLPMKDQLLRISCNYNSYDIIKFFLQDPKLNLHMHRYYLIANSCRFGYHKITEILLRDNRFDFTVDHNYAIKEVCKRGHHLILEQFLQYGKIDPTIDDNYCLMVAIENQKDKIVDLLLQDKRVDPSTNDCLAIRRAILLKDYCIVKLLLEDGRTDIENINDAILRDIIIFKMTDIYYLLKSHKLKLNNFAFELAWQHKFMPIICESNIIK